jgi:hypothetical protein
MTDVQEVSYTGDILAHRRCPRAWLYERHVGLQSYEQVQAMEGNLTHFAMEWLTKYYRKHGSHPNAKQLEDELLKRYSVLRSRGIRSEFAKKVVVVARVVQVIFPNSVILPDDAPPTVSDTGAMDPIVEKCIIHAIHTEYEIKVVRPLPTGHQFIGKKHVLLRGILDVVLQEKKGMTFSRSYAMTDPANLVGQVMTTSIVSAPGDIEIWDYKASQPDTPYIHDYARQLLTYAALYHRNNPKQALPARCVLAFLRTPKKGGSLKDNLIAIPITKTLLAHAETWTMDQIVAIGGSVAGFVKDPASSLKLIPTNAKGQIGKDLAQQCTACGQRFDCAPYASGHPSDCDRTRIDKN